jgi:hypothetical protein
MPGTLRLTVPALSSDKTVTPSLQRRPGQRVAGIVVGSAGLGALAAGGGLAIAAAVKNNQSLKYCLPNAPNQCVARGVVLRNESIRLADTAAVVTSVGAVALTTGGLLFLTARSPRSPERQARVWAMPFASHRSAELFVGAAW